MPRAAAARSTALLLALLPLLAAAPAPAPSFCDAPSSFALEWSDEFSGPALDAATWFAVEGTSPHPFDSTCRGDECPVFSGCREGLCLRRNAWVADGALHLRSDNAGPWPSTFTTAAVASRGSKLCCTLYTSFQYVTPASGGTRTLDPALSARYLLQPQARTLATVLVNAFGFGGNNCSLLFGRAGGAA